MTTRSPARRSKLDHAILASIAAMTAMNIFALIYQAQPAPAFSVPVPEAQTA